MKKSLIFLTLFLTSCTVYTEKQSEAVSKNVYAVNSSLEKARIDMAWFYSNETTKFIKPPKNPIKVNSIYESDKSKTRVVVVPDQYKNDKVVVVGSDDYQNLLKDRDIKRIFEEDNIQKAKQIENDNKELEKQKKMSDKMVIDLNHLQQQIYKKDLAILWRNVIIISLLILIGLYFYAKSNGLFFL